MYIWKYWWPACFIKLPRLLDACALQSNALAIQMLAVLARCHPLSANRGAAVGTRGGAALSTWNTLFVVEHAESFSCLPDNLLSSRVSQPI